MTVRSSIHQRAAGNGSIYVQRRAVNVAPQLGHEGAAWEALTSTALLFGAMVVSSALLLYVVFYVLTALHNILQLAQIALTSY
jgi:hypothetical protein